MQNFQQTYIYLNITSTKNLMWSTENKWWICEEFSNIPFTSSTLRIVNGPLEAPKYYASIYVLYEALSRQSWACSSPENLTILEKKNILMCVSVCVVTVGVPQCAHRHRTPCKCLTHLPPIRLLRMSIVLYKSVYGSRS